MNNENLKDISKRPDFKEITAKGGRANKGKKNLKTILKELLAAQDPEGEWSNPIAKKLLQAAFNEGNYKAIVEIIDRIEGKAKQDLNLGGQKDNPIQIVNFADVSSD